MIGQDARLLNVEVRLKHFEPRLLQPAQVHPPADKNEHKSILLEGPSTGNPELVCG